MLHLNFLLVAGLATPVLYAMARLLRMLPGAYVMIMMITASVHGNVHLANEPSAIVHGNVHIAKEPYSSEQTHTEPLPATDTDTALERGTAVAAQAGVHTVHPVNYVMAAFNLTVMGLSCHMYATAAYMWQLRPITVKLKAAIT